MKNLKFFFEKILFPAAFFFTLMSFAASAILSASSSGDSPYLLSLAGMSRMFLFSFIFSLSNLIFLSKKIPYYFKLLIHFICYIANIFLILGTKGANASYNTLILFCIFAVIYLIIAAIISLIRRLFVLKNKQENTYKKMFN